MFTRDLVATSHSVGEPQVRIASNGQLSTQRAGKRRGNDDMRTSILKHEVHGRLRDPEGRIAGEDQWLAGELGSGVSRRERESRVRRRARLWTRIERTRYSPGGMAGYVYSRKKRRGHGKLRSAQSVVLRREGRNAPGSETDRNKSEACSAEECLFFFLPFNQS
jgi:hypothetical protein